MRWTWASALVAYKFPHRRPHGSDLMPDTAISNFNESEMALFSECRPLCAQTVLDTADIVRDGRYFVSYEGWFFNVG